MKNLLKCKKVISLSVVAVFVIICGFVYTYQKQHTKEAFDYSNYVEPENANKDNTNVTKDIPSLSLPLLQKDNKDIMGILEFDDHIIYDPVAQGANNEYYLYHNFKHQKTGAGIPFIDYQSNVSATNVVIYGHSSTTKNIIFTPLMNYKDEAYFKAHPNFRFITSGETLLYEIVSVFEYDTKDKSQSVEFTNGSWRKLSDYAFFINDIKSRSLYPTHTSLDIKDQLMTLITCDVDDNTNRLVVIARLVK